MSNLEKLKDEGILILDQIIPEDLFSKIKKGFFIHDKFLEDNDLKNQKKDLSDIRIGYEKIIDYCPLTKQFLTLSGMK